jgi:hypothetical protein
MGRVVHDCAVTHCVEARPVPTEFGSYPAEFADELRRIERERAAELAARDRQVADAQRAVEQHVQQAKRDVTQLLRDTEPDPDTTSTASERHLRDGLTSLAEDWTVPAVTELE